MYFIPEAICLDMDGTLLNNYNEVTENTLSTIQELRKAGIRVFIVTGRTYNEVFDAAPENMEVDGFVTANGMVTYVNGRKISEYHLPFDLAEKVVYAASENEIYYEAHPNDGERLALSKDENFMKSMFAGEKPEEVGINEWMERKASINRDLEWKKNLPGQKYAKVFFFHTSAEKIDNWKLQLEEMKEGQNFTTASSSKHSVEVMVEGVSKATGIDILLKHYQLSTSKTMAIGDSNNDIPMMKFVGYPVAMKNATDQIKQIVAETTKYTNDEEGVHRYLANIFR